jgi:hypothetical protein
VPVVVSRIAVVDQSSPATAATSSLGSARKSGAGSRKTCALLPASLLPLFTGKVTGCWMPPPFGTFEEGKYPQADPVPVASCARSARQSTAPVVASITETTCSPGAVSVSVRHASCERPPWKYTSAARSPDAAAGAPARASAWSRPIAGAHAAPRPSACAGEPLTLIRRPSAATEASNPLSKASSPLADCVQARWCVPSMST